MSERIKPGECVTWIGAGGGTREHKGAVVVTIEAGQSLLDWEMSRPGSVGWVAAHSADRSSMARYVIETPEGLRTVRAALLERQNPDAERTPE